MIENGRLLKTYATIMFAFMMAPIVVVVLASLTSAGYVGFPPEGISFRWYVAILDRPEWLSAIRTSLLLALVAAPVSGVMSLSIGYVLTQRGVRRPEGWAMLFTSPLLLPKVLLGLAFLRAYSAMGLTRSPFALIIAHVIITLPFALRFVLIGFYAIDPASIAAARTLGAGQWRIFIRIILPSIKASLMAGVVFAFIMSFDDVAVSLFLARPRMRPLPVAIFSYIDQSFDPLVTALSSVLIIVTILLIVIIERLYGIKRFYETGR